MQKNTDKVVIKIIADVETEEFVLDKEELPYILEDILIDLFQNFRNEFDYCLYYSKMVAHSY